MMTGDRLVVASGRQTFVVTPPASGTLYMSARCTAGDIQEGDTVRVSLIKPGVPYVARMINIYRKDTGEAASEEDPEGEASSEITKGQRQGSHASASRSSTAERRMISKARKDFRIGLRLLNSGRLQAAIEHFDKAREADPSDEMAERITQALGEGASQDSE